VDGEQFVENLKYIIKQAYSVGWPQFDVDEKGESVTIGIGQFKFRTSFKTLNKIAEDMRRDNCNFDGISSELFQYITDSAEKHYGIGLD